MAAQWATNTEKVIYFPRPALLTNAKFIIIISTSPHRWWAFDATILKSLVPLFGTLISFYLSEGLEISMGIIQNAFRASKV